MDEAREHDASGFIDAPLALVQELVGNYVANGHDLNAMRQTVAFVLSVLVERTVVAKCSNASVVKIGDCSLTLEQAHARIEGLRALPVF